MPTDLLPSAMPHWASQPNLGSSTMPAHGRYCSVCGRRVHVGMTVLHGPEITHRSVEPTYRRPEGAPVALVAHMGCRS